MQVQIAYDGSPGAERALQLAASLQYPPMSMLRITAVVQPSYSYVGLAPAAIAPSPELDAEIAEVLREQVSDAAQRLLAGGQDAEGVVVNGRAASALVEEATRSGAELMIAGSRGHGRIASLLLGSVSAELVESAPCPVLIARTDAVSRIVLAVDGSAPAAAAESLLAVWPIFGDVPIHVVSVADVREPLHLALTPASSLRGASEHAASLAEAEAHHTRIADDAAARLRSKGRQADSRMRTGDAADEILKLASEAGADLVVMGSRGSTGLARMVLGSVARNVLHGSTTSVMITRGSQLD